jgi:tetratricopeptide (TPR) repeat protein
MRNKLALVLMFSCLSVAHAAPPVKNSDAYQYYLKALLYDTQGNLVLAQEELSKAIKLSPDNAFLYRTADEYENEKQYAGQNIVHEHYVPIEKKSKQISFNQTFMEKRIETIENQIRDIKDNHLSHIQEDLAVVKTNQEWIMKFFWIVSSASVAGLITGIINLMIK